MKDSVYFLGHLGLGDHIIQQGIVNLLSERFDVHIFAKYHNVKSLAHLCKNRDIVINPVSGDDEVRSFVSKHPKKTFGVGIYGQNWSAIKKSGMTFDKYFYHQLGIEFNRTYIDIEDGDLEYQAPSEPFAFVHDDQSRNLNIRPNLINKDLKIWRPYKSETIFDFLSVIRQAEEIHCIDSSFALMIDRSKDVKAKKFIHRYVRSESDNPSYHKSWDIIR